MATIAINLEPGEGAHPFYHCHFCRKKYEDISTLDIESMTPKVTRAVTDDILRFYGADGKKGYDKVIQRKNRTGIVRRIGVSYFIRRSNQFIICLKINNIRTGITCNRKEEGNDKYYVAESIWRSA